MFRTNLAYRFKPTPAKPEGWLEGFSSFAFHKPTAQMFAINKVKTKLRMLGQEFDETRLITTKNGKGLTKAEMTLLRKDWKISSMSQHT
jgi:hypothetical protein